MSNLYNYCNGEKNISKRVAQDIVVIRELNVKISYKEIMRATTAIRTHTIIYQYHAEHVRAL